MNNLSDALVFVDISYIRIDSLDNQGDKETSGRIVKVDLYEKLLYI